MTRVVCFYWYCVVCLRAAYTFCVNFGPSKVVFISRAGRCVRQACQNGTVRGARGVRALRAHPGVRALCAHPGEVVVEFFSIEF